MRFWWLTALAACYRPVPPEGAPCAQGVDCPTPLICDRGVCVSEPVLDDAAIPVDAPIEPAPAGCVPLWLAGGIATAPVVMPNVNSVGIDLVPYITTDGATFYFASNRDGNADVFRATRAGSTFTNIAVVADLSSTADEGAVSISADGRSAFVASERSGLAAGGRNYWEATRATTADAFGNFSAAPFANVNTNGNEFEIWASHDRLRIYVSRSGNSQQTIALATRTTTSAAFSTPLPIAELTSGATECCHSLSADERVIVFSSKRNAGVNEMFYATRSSRNATFSTPRLVPGVAPPDGTNLHAFLEPDACTLYFASTRTGGPGSFDIWMTGVVP